MKTWTSFLNPSGNSGRIERSMMRADEDLVVVRAPLALDEAARDLAGGVGLLAVLDREREERQGALVVADRHGGEDHRVPELDEGRAGGLLRHAAGLDDQLAPGECPLHALHHCLIALSL